MKKRGFIIIAILAIGISLLGLGGLFLTGFLNVSLIIDNSKKFINYLINISKELIQQISPYFVKTDISFIVFIVLLIILFLISFIMFVRFLKHRRVQKINNIPHEITQKKKRSETNLDVLYNLLKNKKILSVKTIAKFFKIPKEKALEWAKILENHELVTIEYPTFSSPEVKINGKEIKKQGQIETKEKASKKEDKGVSAKEDSKKSSRESQGSRLQKKRKIKRRKK